MLCWATTSRPIVGSSRNRTSGPWSKAAMSSIFIRSPSDSSRTGWPSRRWTSSISARPSRVFWNCCGIDVIDVLVQAERLGGRQVPPELVLLAHHQGEAAAVGVFAFPGHVAHHRRRAAGGGEHAGEQFQRGRLARPVGPQKGDELARLDGQIDAADRLDGLDVAMEKPAKRSPAAPLSSGTRGTISTVWRFR